MKIIWKLDRVLLLPLTHKKEDRSWTIRKWAKGWFIAGHPWLWCPQCGDGFETWHEFWHRKCETCEWIEHLNQ